MRSTRWARAICLGPSIWYACQRPATLARLHRSLALARHAVHLITTATYLWHDLLLSFRTCYFFCTGRHPRAFWAGGRAEVSVRSGRGPYHGPHDGGHCAGCSPPLVEFSICPWSYSSARTSWCAWLQLATPPPPARTLERGGRLLGLVARAHGRHTADS